MSPRNTLSRLVACVAVMSAAGPCTLIAQASISVTVQMPVMDVFALQISPISTSLPVPTWVDFAAGYQDVSTPVGITARANRSYTVTISAAAPTFSYLGSQPDPNKPRTDLQWALTAGGPYTGINTGGTVLSGSSATNGASQDVYYRTLWNISQAPPGAYALAVSFTISAP
jgi:hypothetical protein